MEIAKKRQHSRLQFVSLTKNAHWENVVKTLSTKSGCTWKFFHSSIRSPASKAADSAKPSIANDWQPSFEPIEVMNLSTKDNVLLWFHIISSHTWQWMTNQRILDRKCMFSTTLFEASVSICYRVKLQSRSDVNAEWAPLHIYCTFNLLLTPLWFITWWWDDATLPVCVREVIKIKITSIFACYLSPKHQVSFL